MDREAKGREGKGRAGKGREAKGRDAKGSQGKGSEGKRSKGQRSVWENRYHHMHFLWCAGSSVQPLPNAAFSMQLEFSINCSIYESGQTELHNHHKMQELQKHT